MEARGRKIWFTRASEHVDSHGQRGKIFSGRFIRGNLYNLLSKRATCCEETSASGIVVGEEIGAHFALDPTASDAHD